MATKKGEWKELDLLASMGPVPPDDQRDPKRRLEMQLGDDRSGKWQPTPLGEVVTLAILTLTVRTATPEHQTPVYVALEDERALDRIIGALERSIVREVRRVKVAA